MKINMLLIFLTTMGICIAGNAKDDSGATWGLHEPLKNCVSCHGDRSEQATAEKPNLIAPVPKLCYGCHQEHISPDEWVHGPVAIGKCLLCHEPHEAINKSLLSKPVPELCYQCHEDLGTIYNYLHGPVEGGYCTACHHPHQAEEEKLLRFSGKELCFYCHIETDVIQNEMHQDLGEMTCTDCHNPHGGEDKYIFN